jgi:dTMP kinase
MQTPAPLSSRPGMLITFEGGEGSGKSTQIKLLAEKLQAAGYTVEMYREPGGTRIGEAIRDAVLNPTYKEIAFTTEVLLFQAQRAQLYQEKILPALQQPKTVILIDRSRDSSLVYQGMVRGFGQELITDLNDISTQQTYPDLTVLLDVSVEFGLTRRAKDGDENRIDKEKLEFHQQVREAYLSLAKENSDGRWVIVDADQSIQQVAEHVWQTVQSKLG